MCHFFHIALGAGVFFVSIIIYSVGYCKLTGAVGYHNKTVRKLGLLTRKIAICLAFSVLSSLACENTLLYNCRAYTPLFISTCVLAMRIAPTSTDNHHLPPGAF